MEAFGGRSATVYSVAGMGKVGGVSDVLSDQVGVLAGGYEQRNALAIAPARCLRGVLTAQ
jgi:hypothetical protein